MQIDRGYVSPYFVTDPERMEAVLDEPYILITDKKIGAVKDLLPVLEKVLQAGRTLLIIADDVDGEALATLVVNKLRGTINGSPSRRPASATAARRCSRTSRSSPARDFITEEMGLQARERASSRTSAGPQGRRRQGHDDDHRGLRRREGDPGPHQADQGADREDDVRLRPREAAGAAGQARRRRRGDQGRRRDRGRAEGEEAPRRGRARRPAPRSKRASSPAAASRC